MRRQILLSLLLLLAVSHLYAGTAWKTDAGSISIDDSGNIEFKFKKTSGSALFTPSFQLAYSESKPSLSLDRVEVMGKIDNLNYRTVAWNKESDLFSALHPEPMSRKSVRIDSQSIEYLMESEGKGTLKANLLVDEYGVLLKFEFTASADGYYSIGYCGAPETLQSDADEYWQPLVWTQKRFPGKPYLTPDFLCPLPMTAVCADGISYGVCASPECFPYEPLPTSKNYRFGVSLRNSGGAAQPSLWTPVFGRPESKMKAGDSFSFSIRLIARDSSIMEMQEYLALNLFCMDGYRRDNSIGSMNVTLDNMIDYGMSVYSRFNDELKGCSYETDVPGAIKNTTSLNPLNIAFITDREDIFQKRFVPMYEFLLSRESLLFTVNDNGKKTGQVPLRSLGKPVILASEAAAIYEIGGGQSHFLVEVIQKQKAMAGFSANERYWREQLAMYHATSDQTYLKNAVKAADKYIDENINTLQDCFDYKNQSTSSFWTQLSPRFVELYNMFDTTGDRKYLEAARYAAHRYAQFIWMSPAIPRDSITVNEGGLAPKQKSWGEPIRVPEERVPAWLVSEAGLHCECAATSGSHRGVFPAHYAAYMRRIASQTGDDFLARIANWAIVGRYTTFPGYHINTARTTVYQKPDFPLREHYELNVNSMHYNHVWPQIGIVMDYLVSDFDARSSGAISFPYIAVEAFANLGCRIYGHKPGKFYGESVTLWMPQRLLKLSNPQLNYLTAREGKDVLWIALANQSLDASKSSVSINPDLVALGNELSAKAYVNGKYAGPLKIKDGSCTLTVPGDGLVALKLEGLSLNVSFQEKMLTPGVSWKSDYSVNELGCGMFLSTASADERVYAYVAGKLGDYSKSALHYRIDNGEWMECSDVSFPFEFSIPLGPDASSFDYYFSVEDASGKLLNSKITNLHR